MNSKEYKKDDLMRLKKQAQKIASHRGQLTESIIDAVWAVKQAIKKGIPPSMLGFADDRILKKSKKINAQERNNLNKSLGYNPNDLLNKLRPNEPLIKSELEDKIHQIEIELKIIAKNILIKQIEFNSLKSQDLFDLVNHAVEIGLIHWQEIEDMCQEVIKKRCDDKRASEQFFRQNKEINLVDLLDTYTHCSIKEIENFGNDPSSDICLCDLLLKQMAFKDCLTKLIEKNDEPF